MKNADEFFVPTRSSAGIITPHKMVTFHDIKPATSKSAIKKKFTLHSTQEIDMKTARFEVYKFAQSALHGDDKQKSKIELAIKLGAKPPKNKYKNYKVLKEEMKKKLEEAEKEKEFSNIPIKHKISAHKSKLNKGVLRKKRKIGSGILNTYGKVTKRRH